MTFYDIFLNLCTTHGKKPGTAAKEIPISKSIITRWKKGEGNPTDATLSKIAAYFDCSVDDLRIDSNDPDAMIRAGAGIIPQYYQLSPEDRATVDALIARLATSSPPEH